MTEETILNLLGNYALAAVFLVLYIRANVALVAATNKIADERREDAKELRDVLLALAKDGITVRSTLLDNKSLISPN